MTACLDSQRTCEFESVSCCRDQNYWGYVYDVETGLYYLRSRYYNAKVLRFINADAILSGNLYGYCSNSPLKYVDKNGYIQQINIVEYSSNPYNGNYKYDFDFSPEYHQGKQSEFMTSYAAYRARPDKHYYQFGLPRSEALAFCDLPTNPMNQRPAVFAVESAYDNQRELEILNALSLDGPFDLGSFMTSDADFTEYTICVQLYDQYIAGRKSGYIAMIRIIKEELAYGEGEITLQKTTVSPLLVGYPDSRRIEEINESDALFDFIDSMMNYNRK